MDFQANQTSNDSDSVLNISQLGRAFPPEGKLEAEKYAGKSGKKKKKGKRKKDGVDPKLSLIFKSGGRGWRGR